MKIIEIIDLIEKLETRNNSYWNFYTLVIVAICGWVISQQGQTILTEVKYTLIFGNAVFYFMNLSIIYGTTARIEAFEHELMESVEKEQSIGIRLRENLSNPFLKYRLKFTVATHLIMDAFVILFLFLGLKT